MTTRRRWAGCMMVSLLAPLAAGCTLDLAEPEDGGERVGTARERLVGVPEDGYPTYAELEMLVALNRARADPNNPGAGTAASECSEYRAPVPPLLYDHDLGQAARFHCNHLAVNQGGLSHNTFCDLEADIETACPGAEASCSCVAGTECWNCDTLGGCGTGPGGRATAFGFQGSFGSETGAAGYGSGWAAVGGWVTENCNSGTLAHRHSVTTPNSNVVGTGLNTDGVGCWGDYQFADYGSIANLPIPRIASAFRYGSTYHANYYDEAGAPQQVNVVVDGSCFPMEVELGTGGNLSLTGVDDVADSACHQYYFLAFDAAGERAVYPEAGSYQFGDCGSADYHTNERAPADCEELVCEPSEICGNGLDDDCNGLADDGCGSGGGGAGAGGPGGSGTGGSDADGADGGSDEGCGCSLPGGASAPSGLGWLLATALLVGWRRRRA